MVKKSNNEINPSAPAWLGIDVGGTTVKLALFKSGPSDPRGSEASGALPALTEIGRSVIPTRIENDGVNILPDIAEAIRALAEETGIPLDTIEGAGMGVPGPVLPRNDRGMPVDGCVNLNWTGICYPGEDLRERTGIRHINVLNDANAAALGELYFSGQAEDTDRDASGMTAVMITIGTGIGGGIITKGRIVTGAFGAAGEVGHMPIRPDHAFLSRLQACDPAIKDISDLEHFVSAVGIARLSRTALKAFDEPSCLREVPDLQAKEVFDAAKAGDPLAEKIAAFFFDTFGQGLATIASVVDPDLFIIGGGVAAAGDYLLNGLRESYRRQVFHASRRTRFRLASLGNDAGLMGPLAPMLLKHMKE